MKYMSGFFPGFVLGVFTMVGCASVWPYKYYATSQPDTCYDQGTLLGKLGSGGWPDLPLDTCKPDPDPSPGGPSPTPSPIKLKCMTMILEDFTALKTDDEQCHADLSACQNPPPSGG